MNVIHNEKIMVCVHFGPHGERLIRRGMKLSALINVPLYVLTIDTSDREEYNDGKEKYIAVWKRITEEAGGEFLTRKANGRKRSDIIVETAKEKEVTQIIIGQSCRTFWQELTKGNFINELIGKMDNIDLHIVAVQRMDTRLEETHEEGVNAYLVKNGSRYELSDEPEGEKVLKGVFFHELHTEFENGLFKTEHDGRVKYLHIRKGVLADPWEF